MSFAYFSAYLDIEKEIEGFKTKFLKLRLLFMPQAPEPHGRLIRRGVRGAHSNSPYFEQSKYFEISVFHQKLNSVSSQCAHGKSAISRKPEEHPKNFKW